MADKDPMSALRLTPQHAADLLDLLAEPDGSERSRPHPAPPGYSVIERLAQGGGGEVFLARLNRGDALVALKLLHSAAGDPVRQRRAWREIDLVADLRLPGIPRILDHGQFEGRTFIASEYIPGVQLDAYATSAGLGRIERVELLARIADIVHELHARGVIHRDLKPSNILVTEAGDPVVIDFGLAALVNSHDEQTLTEQGTPLGTPDFMAPEQARGDRHAISTRTDVYALGATLLKLLTGKTPHASGGSIHEVLHRVASLPARDPRELDPSLDRSITAVLNKALAASPSTRYSSAADFAADLRRWLAGEPVEARPPGRWLKITRWFARHPIAATVAICGLMFTSTVVGMGSYVAWMRRLHLEPVRVGELIVGEPRLRIFARSGDLWGDVTTDHGWFQKGEIIAGGGPNGEPLLVAGVRQWDNLGFQPMATLRAYTLKGQPEKWWSYAPPKYPEMFERQHNETRAPHFSCFDFEIADVFPERPGLEVVAVHAHGPNSQTVITVHALDGELLFDVWHDGHVYDVFWSADAGLILCGGANSDGGKKDRMPLGTTLPPLYRIHPTVVFAVRPDVGVFNGLIRPGNPVPREVHPHESGHVVTRLSTTSDEVPLWDYEVEWYRCLLPLNDAAHFDLTFGQLLHGPTDPTTQSGKRCIAVVRVLPLDKSSGNLQLHFDVPFDVTADGHFERRPMAEQVERFYEDNDRSVPRPEGLFWGDLPARFQ